MQVLCKIWFWDVQHCQYHQQAEWVEWLSVLYKKSFLFKRAHLLKKSCAFYHKQKMGKKFILNVSNTITFPRLSGEGSCLRGRAFCLLRRLRLKGLRSSLFCQIEELNWLQVELVCVKSEVLEDVDTLRFTLGWQQKHLAGNLLMSSRTKSSMGGRGGGFEGCRCWPEGKNKNQRRLKMRRKFSLLCSAWMSNLTQYFRCLPLWLFSSYLPTRNANRSF